MSNLDPVWAIRELLAFINVSGEGGLQHGSDEVVARHAHITEQILDRVLPAWRTQSDTRPRRERSYDRWGFLREYASRGVAALEREEELREKLGDCAPQVSAGDFHPWIWGGAASLWQSGHFREAVEGAIRKLNAETQNKLGRRDVSETDLFNQAFSEHPASSNNPRLHRTKNNGSKTTFKSVQRGARMFAEGVFAGIRNPLAHEADQEMPEQQALEYLAALSVLARWVDESTLEVAP